MLRRELLKLSAGLALVGAAPSSHALAPAAKRTRRVRPSDPAWPTPEQWEELKRQVGGNLVQPKTIWAACEDAPGSSACIASLKYARDPYFLGDSPGGTEVSGWLNAWAPAASAYAVAAHSSADVATAIAFARRNNVRLVVKGGGHSYLGGSNAPDSLLIWTRAMNAIELHDAFVPAGCSVPPSPAVSLGAGCLWIDAYHAVTTQAGRYVQGGGCASVGVAGLIQGGGFGSFSKRYGLAAAGLLQAEVVTADGVVRVVNESQHADLFWALRGGGGGSFGVVTRLTLRTHELPARFGFIGAKIKAASTDAYRRLVARIVAHYAQFLFNEHWGEALNLYRDEIEVAMTSQGLGTDEVNKIWAPFFDWVRASPGDFSFTDEPTIGTGPARDWWAPGNPSMIKDDRPDGNPAHTFWRGDQDQVSMFIHGYDSQWLPASLLEPHRQGVLVQTLVDASQFMTVRLHFNKGLAGAPSAINAESRRCAINPAVADAFCLTIVATGGKPPFAGLPGPTADLAEARRNALNVSIAAAQFKQIAPAAGSYVSETDFFRTDWRQAFWGQNYARLKAIKDRYDPDGLFIVHHGVGSEEWSADGFEPRI
jgi:FAD binding domain-containing protein/berberine-like enzyme